MGLDWSGKGEMERLENDTNQEALLFSFLDLFLTF